MGRATLSAAPAVMAAVAVAGLVCFAAPAAAASAHAPAESPQPLHLFGGWSPIKNVSDPHIQELGSWAVAEHVRLANDGLRFDRVVSGEQQVVAGMNYRLKLQATNRDGTRATYGAVVYEPLGMKKRQLLAFKPAN